MLAIAIPNIIMLVSFVMYIKDGTRHAGPKVAWADSSVDVGVAVLDILFSFAGHVVFFELMHSMTNPDEYVIYIYMF